MDVTKWAQYVLVSCSLLIKVKGEGNNMNE
jgi:hypothetical protein